MENIKKEDIELIKKEIADLMKRSGKVMKLHLELQTGYDENKAATKGLLWHYGKIEKSISRDILVPGEMMLHNLHYAIQKAFGWRNSHLHNFAYPEEIFKELTDNKLPQWAKLCGIYFRFPDGDENDLYWDDDYEEGISPTTWLKSKYNGPYYYDGFGEHFLTAYGDAVEFKQANPVLRLGPTFEEYKAGKKGIKKVKFDEAKIDNVQLGFESSMDELLERLPLIQVIGPNNSGNLKEQAFEIADNANKIYFSVMSKLPKLMKAADYYAIDDLYENSDPDVTPLSDTLYYYYDYGDDWTVKITCDEIYEAVGDVCRNPGTDSAGESGISRQPGVNFIPKIRPDQTIDSELYENLVSVYEKLKPICIDADGLPVMDDVGGPNGYLAFLLGVHGKGWEGSPFEDKDKTRIWGLSMGWTGRLCKPKNIL